ncbi:MAG: transposase [Thermaerobacter sp.]|nr:transposase [Thermaerobacter sp.]
MYQAPSEEAGLAALDHFEEVWCKKYPLVVRSWRQNWPELATFFKFPPEVRRLIYTTNIIEGFHRQLSKVTKTIPRRRRALQAALSGRPGRHSPLVPRPELGPDPLPADRLLRGPRFPVSQLTQSLS